MKKLVISMLGAAILSTPVLHAGSWKSVTVGGLATQIYVPATNAALESGRALMINLHGCGQTADDLKNNGNWEKTAEKYGMIVAIPTVPNGGVYMGCWDYYGNGHSSDNRHNKPLISLAIELRDNESLGIDPKQIYVSGLSSGGGEAMVLGCLRPDIFAGTGLNAAPTVGTTVNEISGTRTSVDQAISNCKQLAGKYSDFLNTQLTSSVYGNNDSFVDKKHNEVNAEAMAKIYGATTKVSIDMSSIEGRNNAGEGKIWSDEIGPRVSIIMNQNLGHAWPAGNGAGSIFTNEDSIDYPAYIMKFFFENGRRVNGQLPPEDSINNDPNSSENSDNTTDTNNNDNEENTEIDNNIAEGTITDHINAGRLSWSDYLTWFQKFGLDKFKLYKLSNGKWSDKPELQ